MKKRNIPFGYQYQNGEVKINLCESQVVNRIFNEYMNGSSLLKITNMLNDEKIEFLPNVIEWNKARIKRIIDDKRYLGEKEYEQIISNQAYEEIQTIKSERNTQKGIDRTNPALQINIPVICKKCSGKMHRIHDSRWKYSEKWICQNDECKTAVKISDENFIKNIIQCIKSATNNPQIINVNQGNKSEPSSKIRQLKNEIERDLERSDLNKKELKAKILTYAREKYIELGSTQYLTKSIKADLKSITYDAEESSPLYFFKSGLCNRIVKNIILYSNGEIRLVLKNDKIIGKEDYYDADTNTTTKNS